LKWLAALHRHVVDLVNILAAIPPFRTDPHLRLWAFRQIRKARVMYDPYMVDTLQRLAIEHEVAGSRRVGHRPIPIICEDLAELVRFDPDPSGTKH